MCHVNDAKFEEELNCSFYTKYIMFELKNYRGFMSDGIEE